ncbi:MAG: CCA tRNA nucleotidyltransferase [Campylobacterota bacterium]|nr:CCA tRNA nucleotidyltransferase [Campylobacterota bacterium]
MNTDRAHYAKGKCAFHLTSSQEETLQFLKDLFFPYTNRVYIVGGFVRDSMLNITSNNDIDIEVYDIQPDVFEQLMAQIGAIGVGQSFYVHKYQNIDISLPRTETKTAYGHRGFDVALCNDEKTAAQRRDFTMNALMVDLYTMILYDFYSGLVHLKQKIICIIDKKRFVEDSLRVLRAMRFAAQFGFKIDAKSKLLMREMSLNDLSQERVVQELEKMFKTKYLHFALYYLFSLNIARQIFSIDIDLKTFIGLYKFYKMRQKYFNVEVYPYYFLYILNNYTDIDIHKLVFPKKMLRYIESQNKINFNISLEELHIIALTMPIKKWLGCLDDEIIIIAKKYHIYDDILVTNVSALEVMNDGFKKDAIKKEITRRKLKFIRDKIGSK